MAAVAFFVLNLAIWEIVTILIFSNGQFDPLMLAVAAFIGPLYGVPVVTYLAVTEAASDTLFPNLSRPTAFLLMVAIGLLVAIAFFHFGPGHPSNKPTRSWETARLFLMFPGIPTAIVVAAYLLRSSARSRPPRKLDPD
jgi:hypothetical protein